MHHVVGRQLRQLVCGPGFQSEWLVLLPVRALLAVIGAQESMNALRGIAHVPGRFARRLVPVIMLAWPRKRREVIEKLRQQCRSPGLPALARRFEWQRR